jgi:hypothetical protein
MKERGEIAEKTEKVEKARFDQIFSYWIFVWYLLYVLGIISYNPKFALIIGVITNILVLLIKIIFKNSIYNIVFFITVNFVIKVIPLYFLWNSKILMEDVYASIGLFSIYLVWLYFRGITIEGLLKKGVYILKYDKIDSPILGLFDKF